MKIVISGRPGIGKTTLKKFSTHSSAIIALVDSVLTLMAPPKAGPKVPKMEQG